MRLAHGLVLAALSLALSGAGVFAPAAAAAPLVSPGDLDAAMAAYRVKLKAYVEAREAYEQVAGPYWGSIAEKRRDRFAKRARHETIALEDYELRQPPVYAGPPRPIDPSAPDKPPPEQRNVPVVADFVAAAGEHYDFAPLRPDSEIVFKHAYAQIAAGAGLTRDQAVRIYAFECGGNGTYDVQAGLEAPRSGAKAISTALGYNQLLTTNSVELMAESGERFVTALTARARTLSGISKLLLENKIAVMRSMIALARKVPDRWSEHERLGGTAQGYAMHALNLDVDAGPFLQTQKLLDSVNFARRKGYARALSAAELEMMNLTGDGNGFDMVVLPDALRDQVPTANFFGRGGYERNPVAIRNNVVAKLLAATDAVMDRGVKLRGAQDLAAAFPR